MKRFSQACVWLGFLAGGVYLARGFFVLVSSPVGASDLFRRHSEVSQIFHGQSPYDIYASKFPEISRQIASETGRVVPLAPRGTFFEPANVPAYPPWSLPLLVVTAGVPWPIGRWYFAALNLISLFFVYRWMRGLGAGSAPSLAAALAVSTIGMTLGQGQYGVIVIGLTAMAWLADRNGRWILGGICLAASMLKFNITLPFVLVFAFRKRWRLLASALASGLALTLLGCWSIGTGPITAMRELSILLSHNLGGGDSLPQAISQLFGYSDHLVTVATIVCFAVGFFALYRMRAASDLELFAMAAVIGRVAIYHRHYDNLVLFLLLAALLAQASTSFYARAAFWLAGVSLWLPPRFWNWLGENPLPVAFQYTVWVMGATVLVLTNGGKRDVRV